MLHSIKNNPENFPFYKSSLLAFVPALPCPILSKFHGDCMSNFPPAFEDIKSS